MILFDEPVKYYCYHYEFFLCYDLFRKYYELFSFPFRLLQGHLLGNVHTYIRTVLV